LTPTAFSANILKLRTTSNKYYLFNPVQINFPDETHSCISNTNTYLKSQDGSYIGSGLRLECRFKLLGIVSLPHPLQETGDGINNFTLEWTEKDITYETDAFEIVRETDMSLAAPSPAPAPAPAPAPGPSPAPPHNNNNNNNNSNSNNSNNNNNSKHNNQSNSINDNKNANGDSISDSLNDAPIQQNTISENEGANKGNIDSKFGANTNGNLDNNETKDQDNKSGGINFFKNFMFALIFMIAGGILVISIKIYKNRGVKKALEDHKRKLEEGRSPNEVPFPPLISSQPLESGSFINYTDDVMSSKIGTSCFNTYDEMGNDEPSRITYPIDPNIDEEFIAKTVISSPP